jgi:hypothetical protein
VPQGVGRLECEDLVSALLSGGGQPIQQLGPQLCVGILLGRRGDDVLYLCGVPVVQLRDDVVERRSLVADASGYLHWLRAVCCLHPLLGVTNVNHTRNVFVGPLKGPFCKATSSRPRCRWEDCCALAAWINEDR